MTENEVVVTLDGRPRPATVVEHGPERTLVRFRDAGTFREEWVPNSSVVAVEAGRDRSTLYKLVGLTVVGALGLVLLLAPGGSDKPLSQVLPTASSTPSSSATPNPSPTPSATPGGGVHAVVLGDAFAAGHGLAKGQPTALQVAATQLRWDTTYLDQEGTGFTTGGKHGGQPYEVRLRALTDAPSLLLLQGGASDTSATPEQLTAAANTVLNDLASRFPSTRVIMLGPVAMEQPPDGQLVRVDGTLRAVAAAHKTTYIDPIALHWITALNAPSFTADTGFYPNAAGHVYLGHKLAQALGG